MTSLLGEGLSVVVPALELYCQGLGRGPELQIAGTYSLQSSQGGAATQNQ